MEGHSQTLHARNLGDLLNETFIIYGKRFRSLVGLVAMVQVPVSLLALIPGESLVPYIITGILSLLASMWVYGAIICAVGQHYVAGEIRIVSCFSRVWWRIVSLLALTGMLLLSLAVGLLLGILVVPLVALSIYLIYWSLAFHAVIVEGFKPIGALRRSFDLVRGSWWRVSVILSVLTLVLIGLVLLVYAPFAIVSYLVSPDESTAIKTVLQYLGSAIAAITVTPVAAITVTLLYYDLRVRKENYDFATLSQEMGIAAA